MNTAPLDAFSSIGLADLRSSVNASLSWLSLVGVRVNSTRFARYQELFSEFYARERTYAEWLQWVSSKRLEIYGAMLELDELDRIYTGLSRLDSTALRMRLKNLSNGPLLYIGERPFGASARARNIGYELALLASAANSDLKLNLGSTCDVSFGFERRSILIECKRLQAVNKVGRRVIEAERQLQRHYQHMTCPRVRGIVALDITKLINPTGQIFSYSSRDVMSKVIPRKLIDLFLQTRAQYWRKFSSRTMGVLARYREVAIIPAETAYEPYIAEVRVTQPFCSEGSIDEHILFSLVRRLDPRRATT